MTFAPKDVTPVDFNPRLGVQGLGYRGLNPGLALPGRGAPEHLDLFRPQSETRSRLFGDKRASRRGGVAGQVGAPPTTRGSGSRDAVNDIALPAGFWGGGHGGRR